MKNVKAHTENTFAVISNKLHFSHDLVKNIDKENYFKYTR